MPPPVVCPECRSPGIRYSGLGTQRLEAEVKARFPAYRSLRMDTDTMQKPGSHQRALAAFHSGDVRILLGTQMIAKGLDFPNVTLVGVINADTALHLPDFRAAERTFQLVTQVAGRTGRGERGGRVLVQTFSPEHPAILAAVRHDYRNVRPRRTADPQRTLLSAVCLDDSADRARAGRSHRRSLCPDCWASACATRSSGTASRHASWVRRRLRSPGCAANIASSFKPKPSTVPRCGVPWPKPRPASNRSTTCNGSPTSIRSTCCERDTPRRQTALPGRGSVLARRRQSP